MKIIPIKVKRIWRAAFKTWRGTTYYCPLCENSLKYLDPFPEMYLRKWKKNGFVLGEFQETLNFKNYHCPVCKSNDRDRMIALYILRYTQQFNLASKYNFLEIGPSDALKPFFKGFEQFIHRSADLFRSDVDDKGVDISNMHQYKTEFFDIILCSHVLEHVPEDRKAMSELYRVLKPGGLVITLVPIFLNLDTSYEKPGVVTDAEKWKHFGQGDHVRLYSKNDFIHRLEHCGFDIETLGADFFGKEIFHKMAITENSVLYIAHKK